MQSGQLSNLPENKVKYSNKYQSKKRKTMIKTIGDLREATKHLDNSDFIYAVTAFPEKKLLGNSFM